MKTGKITLGLASAMFLGALTAASAAGGLQLPLEDAPEGKTYVCHFGGHDQDRLDGFEECNAEGGIILLVSTRSVCNGHRFDKKNTLICRIRVPVPK